MNEAVNSGRSANKRAVIDIRGDASNEPPVKKEAEPVPTKEMLELQQKLAKTEKEKQGAIRIAGELQARVDFLENLIDKKPVTVDDSDKKVIDEQQKKIDDLSSKLVELTNQLEEEKELFNTRIDNLSTNRNELADELIAEKGLLKEEKKRVRSLTKELESERSQADADRMRIDELTIARDELERKLADSEQKRMDELRSHRAKLAQELAEVDEREQKLAEEQQQKLAEQLEAVRRAAAGRERQQPERIVKLTRSKLNQNESGQQQMLPNQSVVAVQQQSDNVSLKKVGKTEIDVSKSDSCLVKIGAVKIRIGSSLSSTAVAAAAPAANDGASTSETKKRSAQEGEEPWFPDLSDEESLL